MVGRNAKHEAPHAWTNGFLGVGSRLGADAVCRLNLSLMHGPRALLSNNNLSDVICMIHVQLMSLDD